MTNPFADVTAVILAGGLGTRLRSKIADRPKVLAPVHGRPYLTYLLEQLAQAGLRRVVLLTGYRGEQIEAAFGSRSAGLHLIYSREPSPLGTAGALRYALPHLTSPNVLVLNGDSYCAAPLAEFEAFHHRNCAACSLVLSRVEDGSRFGRVHCDDEDRILRFAEKSPSAGAGWVNAGIYLIDRSRIEEIATDNAVSLERDLFPTWALRGRCFGFPCDAPLLDIGTPDSYAEAELFFTHG